MHTTPLSVKSEYGSAEWLREETEKVRSRLGLPPQDTHALLEDEQLKEVLLRQHQHRSRVEQEERQLMHYRAEDVNHCARQVWGRRELQRLGVINGAADRLLANQELLHALTHQDAHKRYAPTARERGGFVFGLGYVRRFIDDELRSYRAEQQTPQVANGICDLDHLLCVSGMMLAGMNPDAVLEGQRCGSPAMDRRRFGLERSADGYHLQSTATKRQYHLRREKKKMVFTHQSVHPVVYEKTVSEFRDGPRLRPLTLVPSGASQHQVATFMHKAGQHLTREPRESVDNVRVNGSTMEYDQHFWIDRDELHDLDSSGCATQAEVFDDPENRFYTAHVTLRAKECMENHTPTLTYLLTVTVGKRTL
ncbi:hypothetical protein GF342_03995 [Candidatus Woesearchaeota archaeon]|nr:hypothetical protein [Candidatus Woesearchaeota archaeon]